MCLHERWLLDDDGPSTQLTRRCTPEVHHDVTDGMHGMGHKVKHLRHTPQQPLLLLQGVTLPITKNRIISHSLVVTCQVGL